MQSTTTTNHFFALIYHKLYWIITVLCRWHIAAPTSAIITSWNAAREREKENENCTDCTSTLQWKCMVHFEVSRISMCIQLFFVFFSVDWEMRVVFIAYTYHSVHKTPMNSHPLSMLYHLMTDELFSPSLWFHSFSFYSQLDRWPIVWNYGDFVLVTAIFTFRSLCDDCN